MTYYANSSESQSDKSLNENSSSFDTIKRDDWIDINIQEFIPGVQPEIPLNSTISIYGRRRSGKSEFAKWLIQGFKEHVPWWWVFSQTKFNSFWSAIIPDKFIIGEFDGDVLDTIKKRQILALTLYTEGKIENPHAVVMWDDYSGDDIRYNKSLEKYYYTGRHFGTLNLFLAQYIKLTPPPIRSNTELVILFNTDYGDSIDDYHKFFASKMPKKQFYWLFREYCEKVPHGFLAIVSDKGYDEDKFYHGVADLLPITIDHIVGCEEFWKGSEKQLEDIADGSMQEKFDKLKLLGEPTAVKVNAKPSWQLR